MAVRVVVIALGGIAFWLPVALLAVLAGENVSLTLLNVSAVACALCAYLLLTRTTRLRKLRFLALYMLAGIYVLGPLAMATSSWATGGGTVFHSGRDLLLLAVVSLVPPLTMLLVGDCGLILALLAITGVLIFASTRRRQLP